MELGIQLRKAREKTGLSLTDVKDKTGLGESSLSEFENGKREPKIKQLVVLAELYGRPLSFFLGEEGEVEDKVLWRMRPAEGADLYERRFFKLCAQYRRLEEWTNNLVSPQLPGVDYIRNYADVEALASKVGHELNLGERPAFALYSALEEDCGIKIFHEAIEPTGTAACVRSKLYGWAILLNTNNAHVRRNFDLAHELFHLLTWTVYRVAGTNASSPEPSTSDASSLEEQYADKFASCLLLPGDAMKRAIDRWRNAEGSVPLAVIPDIAKQFGVSSEALLWRLHWVYNWGSSRVEETRNLIQKAKLLKATSTTSDEAKERPSKCPERYRALAVQALRNGELSTGRFMEYTEASRREAMSYLEQEEAALGEVQLTVA